MGGKGSSRWGHRPDGPRLTVADAKLRSELPGFSAWLSQNWGDAFRAGSRHRLSEL
jgi:hypothetical protein